MHTFFFFSLVSYYTLLKTSAAQSGGVMLGELQCMRCEFAVIDLHKINDKI